MTFPELDDDLLQFLGEDPSSAKALGKDIQKDLAIRLQHMATNGLSRELRKELKDRYLIPANCLLIDAPAQYPEIPAAVNETNAKRLKAIENKQKLLASAISCLAEALTSMLVDKDKNTAHFKLLMDAYRILCDAQYNESMTRRSFILSMVKKEMREPLKDRKIDNFIFGDNLLETIKTARAINKTGAELKLYQPNRSSSKKPGKPKQALNQKSSPSTRRSTGPVRTAAPAGKQAPADRQPPATSARACKHKPRSARR